MTSVELAVATAVAGQQVTVRYPGGAVAEVMKMRHVAVAAGDLVHLSVTGAARWIDGSLGPAVLADPAPDVAEPAGPEDATTGVWACAPQMPGSWRSGGWRTDTADLWQGQAGGELGWNAGAAWYGLAPASLPGTITAAEVTLIRADTGPPVAPTMTLLAGIYRVEEDEPVVLASTLGPLLGVDDPAVRWPVPQAWLAHIQAGTAGGIGCHVPAATPPISLSSGDGGMTLTLYWEDTP